METSDGAEVGRERLSPLLVLMSRIPLVMPFFLGIFEWRSGLTTIPIFSSRPKAVPAGAGYVRRVPTAKGGFFRRAEEMEVAEVMFSLRRSHSGNGMSLTSVPGKRYPVPCSEVEQMGRHRQERQMRFGSRAGDAREQHSGNKCLGGQVRGSHRGMVGRPEAGCEPEEKAWQIPGISHDFPGIFRTFGALCAGTGLGVKPKCGAGVDFTVHGGGSQESGGVPAIRGTRAGSTRKLQGSQWG